MSKKIDKGWVYSGQNIKDLNIMTQKTYSVKITLQKGIKYFGIFLFPFLVDRFIFSFPELAQLTLGSVLVMIANYIKVKSSIE
jgi:hypothetical protein